MNKTIKSLAIILFIALIPFLTYHKVFNIAFNSFVDAYFSVTIFVAATLILLEIVESFFDFRFEKFNEKNPKYQVAISTILGALPGCGGAIVVLTQFCERKVSFGSVVASLTATMGDASFLLLSKEPMTGIVIILMSIAIGIVVGYTIDFIHGRDFMKIESSQKINIDIEHESTLNTVKKNKATLMETIWIIILVPGILLGLTKTIFFGIEENYPNLEIAMNIVGFIGAGLSVLMFYSSENSITGNVHDCKSQIGKVVNDTNFITFWVICSFLFYYYTTYFFNINLEDLFKSHEIFLPLIAILVGFIPGCGPQIVVTTLYVNGLIPLSAQIGNAISNDGDALFPAIAISPKAAILATVYSAIPALIVSYSYMAIFE